MVKTTSNTRRRSGAGFTNLHEGPGSNLTTAKDGIYRVVSILLCTKDSPRMVTRQSLLAEEDYL